MNETYRVELDVYSGPLDLLLQLVTRAEVNIYDIPVARITDQYLEQLRTLPELDLETAADFLVLAATLLALKARMLLPAPPQAEEEGPAEEEDPRAELVRRLVLYRQFREAAGLLGKRLERANTTFDRGLSPVSEPVIPTLEAGCLSAGLTALAVAYQAAWAAWAAPPPAHQVSPLPFTVGEKMEIILDRLERLAVVAFEDLVPAGRARDEVVATFLALLELVRLGKVRARQEKVGGRLEVVRCGETRGVVEA